jgi:hypothetical protein
MRLASGGSPRDDLAMRRHALDPVRLDDLTPEAERVLRAAERRVGTLLLDLKRTPPQKAAQSGDGRRRR